MNTYVTSKTVLQQITSIANALKTDVIAIHAKEKGWELRMIDPAHVSAVKMEIPKERFERYEQNDPQLDENSQIDDAFGIPTEKMGKILSILGDTVQMDVDDRIIFRSKNITRTISKNEVDPAPKFPNMNATTCVEIDTSETIRAMGTASFTDAIRFKTNKEGTTIWADGDTDSLSVTLEKATAEEEAEASYPMDYIMNALKALPKTVTLSYSTDYPMILICFEPFSIELLVAPRIEQGEPQ